MALRPSDNDVGCQILEIFVRRKVPVSGMLQRTYFFEVRDGDFQRGIDFAVANNWITVDQRNRYRYQLTATGYAAGRMNFAQPGREAGGGEPPEAVSGHTLTP